MGCEGTGPNTAPLQEMNHGKNGSPPDLDCSEQALLGGLQSQEESPNPTSCSLADVSSSTERITESTVITLPDAGMPSDCTVVQSEDSSSCLCCPITFLLDLLIILLSADLSAFSNVSQIFTIDVFLAIVSEGSDGEITLVSQEQEKDEEEEGEERTMKRKGKILGSPKAIVPYSSMLIFSSTNPYVSILYLPFS